MRRLMLLAFLTCCGKEPEPAPVKNHLDAWPVTGRITCILKTPGIIEAVYSVRLTGAERIVTASWIENKNSVQYNDATTYDIRGINEDTWRWEGANRAVLWSREWDVTEGERWWRFSLDIDSMKLTATALGDVDPRGDWQTEDCAYVP